MKAKKLLLSLLFLTVLGGSIYYFVNTKIVKESNDIVLNDLQLDNIDDGIYIGEYALSPVKVKVEVAIKNHRVEKIEILEHQKGIGKKAEKITEDVVNNQSLNVDVVSGATVSSKVILKAVDNAVNK